MRKYAMVLSARTRQAEPVEIRTERTVRLRLLSGRFCKEKVSLLSIRSFINVIMGEVD